MTSPDHQFEPDFSVDAPKVSGFSEPEVTRSSKWIDRLSVEKKLQIAVLGNTIVLGLLVSLVLLAALFFTEEGRIHAFDGTAETRAGNAVIALYEAAEGLDAAENAVSNSAREQAFDQSRQALTRAMVSFEEAVQDEEQAAQHITNGSTFFQLQERVIELNERFSGAITSPARLSAFRNEMSVLKADINTFAASLRSQVASREAALFSDIFVFLLVFLVITIGCVFAAIFGARVIASNVSSKIKELTSTMDQIVAGDTAISIPNRERSDEIGDMARALEVFRHSTVELSELTRKRATEVEAQFAQQKLLADEMRSLKQEKSQLLENLANGFEVSVGELITSVSAASEQLKSTSAQMVALADGSNGQADSASAAMKNTSSNVTAAAAATDEFALSINEISQQATASASLARDATALVASANTRMNDLSSAAEEVGEIAGLIQTIAQRTNLLALNASIEAARGGEAGRGFAVVASEVKELAMQTSSATSSVAEKINAMQDSTRSSASDLTSIYDQIGELEKVAVVIATAVDQQSVSGEELARNIDTVAEGSRQVSELLVALREASEETGSAADDVVESANSLGRHADDLREKAGRFIEDIRRSARELEADEKAA